MSLSTAEQHALIMTHWKNAERTVGKWVRRNPSCTNLYEDLLQEARLGLVRAARTFDASKGASFTTHSITWMDEHIRMALRRFRSIVCNPPKQGIPTRRDATLEKLRASVEFDDPSERIDGERLRVAMDRELAWIAKARKNGERDVQIYLAVLGAGGRKRGCAGARAPGSFREIGLRFGLSGERVRTIALEVGRELEPWFEELREEAA